jgi:general stress protein 26
MAEITREEAIRKIADLIGQVQVAMLTTTSSHGILRSRPMVAQEQPFDGILWFLTSRSAAKAADVRDRRQVNVCYSSTERECYVSVSGMAMLVEDRERARSLWNEAYGPWFPKGLDDPELVLIRIEAQEAGYWDSQARRMTVVSGLQEAKPGFHDWEPGVGW